MHRGPYSLFLLFQSLSMCLLATQNLISMQKELYVPSRAQEFCEAIKVRDLQNVRRMLRDNPGLVNQRFLSRTPLYWAVDCGFLEIAKLLVLKGAHVNVSDRWLRTPLHFATKRGAFGVMRFLILAGAQIDVQDNEKKTVLHYAAQTSDLRLIRLLVTAGADLNIKDQEAHTPLFEARTYAVADFLIDAGAKSRIVDSKLTSVLYYAAQRGRDAVARRLVEEGDDTWPVANMRRTALHRAAVREHLCVLECLLRAGAEVDPQNQTGRTPLHLAAFFDNAEVVRCLMMAGADVEVRDNVGQTPFQLAVRLWHRNIVEAFIRFGVSISREMEIEVRRALAGDNWKEIRKDCVEKVFRVLESDDIRMSTRFPRDINLLLLRFSYGNADLFVSDSV